ncbi:GNAT family N-acetyltransferase [Roseibium sp.]|uniref:GNAT family N-acetyltransferase n=1 Tax=Roseibium sp. TaxID=1936156 RepID=UPI003A9690A3
MCWPDPFCTQGKFVRLVPLHSDHTKDLAEAAADGDVHKLWYTSVPAPENVPAEIDRRLGLQKDGSMLPFAIIGRGSAKAVGMTTFMNIDALNRRVEIGSTWYRKAVQRSPFNTECKILLLRHAFEELNCIAVEFRTHFMNRQSRAAIERLGAKLDGILRSHQLMEDGSLRDTVVYSIIASEWPAVRANLEWQMEKPRK